MFSLKNTIIIAVRDIIFGRLIAKLFRSFCRFKPTLTAVESKRSAVELHIKELIPQYTNQACITVFKHLPLPWRTIQVFFKAWDARNTGNAVGPLLVLRVTGKEGKKRKEEIMRRDCAPAVNDSRNLFDYINVFTAMNNFLKAILRWKSLIITHCR